MAFEWTIKCEEAFKTLMLALTSDPIIKLPDMDKSFIIRTDASGTALGAMLAQKHDGRTHPVADWSRKLNDAEQKYTTTEREGLAVVAAVKHWNCYIEGTRFLALKSLLATKEPSGRMARWVMELQRHDMEIQHRPGKEMGIPDALSRDARLMVMLKEGVDVNIQPEDSQGFYSCIFFSGVVHGVVNIPMIGKRSIRAPIITVNEGTGRFVVADRWNETVTTSIGNAIQ